MRVNGSKTQTTIVYHRFIVRGEHAFRVFAVLRNMIIAHTFVGSPHNKAPREMNDATSHVRANVARQV